MNELSEILTQKRYIVQKFPSGLKNNVGRIVLDGVPTKYVLKKFPRKKDSDITDWYKNEKKALSLFSGFGQTPVVQCANDQDRYLVLNFIDGTDLEISPQDSSHFQNGLEEALKTLRRFDQYSRTFNKELCFRKIDLRRDACDGLDMMSESGQITPNKKLIDAAIDITDSITTKQTLTLAHGCLTPGNIIYDEAHNRASFVDLELAAYAPMFYDLGFFMSRLKVPKQQKVELIRIYAKESGQDPDYLIREVDCYKTVSNILLIGLDCETIMQGNDPKGIHKKRTYDSLSSLRSPFSNNELLLRFVELFNDSTLAECLK